MVGIIFYNNFIEADKIIINLRFSPLLRFSLESSSWVNIYIYIILYYKIATICIIRVSVYVNPKVAQIHESNTYKLE